MLTLKTVAVNARAKCFDAGTTEDLEQVCQVESSRLMAETKRR